MVEFKDVSVTYSSGVDALNKVNLKINDGDFAFVVGPSGAGKSTLIKLVLKEIDATSGTVRYLSSSQLFQIEAVYHYCTAGRIYFFKHQLDKC